MHHGYFKDRISAYHDGDLRPEEMELIARHLEGCEECRQLLSQLEKFDALVEKHSGLAGDDYFERSAQKIESLIAGERKPEIVDIKRPSWLGLGWKVAVAAASFAVIGFIGLHQSDIMEELQQEVVAPTEKAPAVPAMTDSAWRESVVIEPVEEFQPETELKDDAAREMLDVSLPVPTTEVRKADKTEPVGLAGADVGSTEQAVADEEAEARGGHVQPVESAEKKVVALEEELDSYSDTAVKRAKGPAVGDKKATPYPAPSVDSPAVPAAIPETGVKVQGLMAESADLLTDRVDSESPPSKTLEEWRQTRDSCRAEVARLGAVGKGARSVRLSDADKKDEKAGLEKTLLDAWYNIGLLTNDPSEFDKAVGYMKEYIAREDGPHRELARQYLEELTALQDG